MLCGAGDEKQVDYLQDMCPSGCLGSPVPMEHLGRNKGWEGSGLWQFVLETGRPWSDYGTSW